MNYLTDIPEGIKDYGFNKILIVRSLSIDFKHRDSQLFLRSNDYKKYGNISTLKTRANQLRLIYHISRKSGYEHNVNSLIKIYSNYSLLKTVTETYIDFISIKQNKTICTNNSIIFSFFTTKKEIMQYLIDNSLKAPKDIVILSIKELYKLNKNNLVTIVLSEPSINKLQIDLKRLWYLNFYIFKSDLSFVSFKTNETL